MKNLIAILALVMVSQAQAQGQNPGVAAAQSESEAVVVPVEAQAAPVTSQGNPIYIINKNRVSGSQDATQGAVQGTTATQSAAPVAKVAAVQEQPASVVQDSPLKESPADQMRKRRQATETATEDGIVTALERARMDDEMKRRDKFNSAISPVSQDATVIGNGNTVTQAAAVQQNQAVAQQAVPQQLQQQPTQAILVQPVALVQQAPVQQAPPVQQVAPQPVAQPIQRINVVEEDEITDADLKDTKKDDKVDVKQEIRSAIAEQNENKDKNNYYVAAIASFGQYNNIQNINNSLGYGVAVGTVLPSRIVVEGTFLYGDYTLQNMYSGYGTGYGGYGSYNALQVDMRQYDVGGAVKYQFLPGRFKPVAGVILDYARRDYSFGGQSFMTSDAIDVGGLLGADLQLADSFSIGVDFRYFTNLGSRENVNGGQLVYQQSNDPEKLDFYTLNLIGKFTF